LILSARVVIGSAGLPVGQVVAAIAVFTVIAAISVAAPVVGYRLAPANARAWLGGLKMWLAANNAAVTMTLFFVIGVVLIGKGIGSL
jgi:Sap, sulfolipid-1-addressing protein